MELTFSSNWAVAVFLCSLRLGVIFAMTPILNSFSIPIQFRVLITVLLAVSFVSSISPVVMEQDLSDLLIMSIREIMLGALLAFGVYVAFGAISMAGRLLDVQVGFSIANVFDPVTRTQSPLLASMFDLLAIVVFFSADGHHALFRGFAQILELVPIGSQFALQEPVVLVQEFGLVFIFGLMLAAPVFFFLLLVDVGLAVVSKSLPQINLLVLGPAIKVLVGLMVLATVFSRIQPIFVKNYAGILDYWAKLVH